MSRFFSHSRKFGNCGNHEHDGVRILANGRWDIGTARALNVKNSLCSEYENLIAETQGEINAYW